MAALSSSQRSERALSIIAPCFNEEGNIDALVQRVLAALDAMHCDAELILIDDGSSDATWNRIQTREAQDGRVHGVRHSTNRGIVPAWRTGLAAARGTLVCLIDSDLQNRPEDISRLYDTYVEGGADIVQGVRHAAIGVTRLRLFSRGLNLLLNLMFCSRLRDNKSGFVLCERTTLERILSHRYQYRYFQSLIGVSALANGLRIAEVDTVFEPRVSGQSFLSRFPVIVSLRIVWELLKFRVETLFHASENSLARPVRHIEPLVFPES
ncbi:MAG: glycosyltransferase family 2 protein [Planctomycetes bacterium]|nr:glycosyltransferase family 2 protein [Planctomycetota bacterium]MBI3832846.1 glycosyltransferase family 2 protein [Planctomycetota bacterium]